VAGSLAETRAANTARNGHAGDHGGHSVRQSHCHT
jgi:hypothetical protein